MSSTFDDILESVKEFAEAAGRKTNEIVDVSKLKIELSGINSSIKKSLENLGAITYNAAKNGTDSAVIDSVIEELDELYAKRDECKAKINAAKRMRKCAACGAANNAAAAYCNVCGEKLVK